MKQLDYNKDLLIKEINARIPYGLYIAHTQDTILGKRNKPIKVDEIHADGVLICANGTIKTLIDDAKLYLRELTSLEVEEWNTYQKLANDVADGATENITKFMDWVYSNHIDYNSLIDKGYGIAITDDNDPYDND